MNNPGDVMLMVAVFAVAISAHELAHAYAAKLCGDRTAEQLGRISLNPLVHIDLFGTIILPAFLILSGSPIVAGWAKPVPVNRSNLNSPRRDSAVVSAAGPATNLLLAAGSILITVLFFPLLVRIDGLYRLLFFNTTINIVLAVFNMLPVPPLDGGNIFKYFATPEQEQFFIKHRYIVLILFMLLFISGILGAVFSFFINLAHIFQAILLNFIWGV